MRRNDRGKGVDLTAALRRSIGDAPAEPKVKAGGASGRASTIVGGALGVSGEWKELPMAMLHRFTLKHNKQLGGWALVDQTGDIVRIFATKAEALARGQLEIAIGKEGGTVRIHRQDGQFAEERTFPRSQDPRTSPS